MPRKYPLHSDSIIVQDNDQKIHDLGNKVGVIKRLSEQIQIELSEHNLLIESIETEMDNNSSLVKKASHQLQLLSEKSGFSILTLVIFSTFIFVLLYFLAR